MLYITSGREVADFVELNLLCSSSAIVDKHFIPVPLSGDSRIRRLGECVCHLGPHRLFMDPATASWALLDDHEARIFRMINDSRLSDLMLIPSAPPKDSLLRFVQALYRRALVSIDGKRAIAPNIYEGSGPMHDAFLCELLLSERCNMACLYCQASAGAGKRDMPTEVAEAAVREAFALPSDLLLFEMSGGEPLLNFDVLCRTTELIESYAERTHKTVVINLVSNGTLLTRSMIEYISSHGIRLTLSVDGPQDMHDTSRPLFNGRPSWSVQQRSIKLLNDCNVPFSVVLTVSKVNAFHAREVARFLSGLGASSVKINPVLNVGRAKHSPQIHISPKQYLAFMIDIFDTLCTSTAVIPEDISSEMVNRLITKFRDYRCMRGACRAGASYVVVTPSGTIFPCALMTDFRHATLGNVLDPARRLDDLPSSNGFIERFQRRVCCPASVSKDCVWRNLCRGGCIAEALSDPGCELDQAVDRNCYFYQGMYSHIFKRLSNDPESIERYVAGPCFRFGPGRVINQQLVG